jgi:hypothetical protein
MGPAFRSPIYCGVSDASKAKVRRHGGSLGDQAAEDAGGRKHARLKWLLADTMLDETDRFLVVG